MISKLRHILTRRQHVRAHAWQSLAGYCQTLGAMVLGVILARLLSPEVFGQLAYITAVITAMIVPLNISSSQVLVTDGGKTPNLFPRVMGLTAITMASKLCIVGLFVIWQAVHGDAESAVVGFLVGVPAAMTDWLDVLRSDLEGRGYFKPNFVAQSTSLLVHAATAILLVLCGWGIYGLAFAYFAAFLPQIFTYFSASGRKPTNLIITKEGLRSQLRVGFWLWLSSTCGSILLKIDKVALGRYGGETQLGYYNRALNYSPFCMLAMGSLLTNASVVALRNQSGQRQRKKTFAKLAALMIAGAAINGLVLHYFSDPLVVWVFGQHWQGSIPVFQAFAWIGLAYALYYLPMNVLLANDDYRVLAFGRVAGLLAFCGVLWLMQSRGALTGANVAYAFSLGMGSTGIFSAIVWALDRKARTRPAATS